MRGIVQRALHRLVLLRVDRLRADPPPKFQRHRIQHVMARRQVGGKLDWPLEQDQKINIAIRPGRPTGFRTVENHAAQAIAEMRSLKADSARPRRSFLSLVDAIMAIILRRIDSD